MTARIRVRDRRDIEIELLHTHFDPAIVIEEEDSSEVLKSELECQWSEAQEGSRACSGEVSLMVDQTTDTNLVENEVDPGVLGRNYWLFSGNPQDAYTSAARYRLIETAKVNDLEPDWYLRSILEKLPHASTEGDFCTLLSKNVPEQ